MDTGHAGSFGAAGGRNVLRVAGAPPPPSLSGLILVAFHPRRNRLGGTVARTVVARDPPQETASSRPVATPPPAPSLPELDDETFRVLSQFAARQATLEAPARARVAQ